MATVISDRTLNGRIWRFSDCVFDDLRMDLQVAGKEVRLEPKPLEVLQLLVSRAGEVITKAELLDAVWPDEAVVEGVLTTNINKLREAVGDGDKKLIVTLRGIGYKLVGDVQWENATSTVESVPAISVGCAVPGREQWRLERRLDQNPTAGGVWLAEHARTHERRVFKFALDGSRLRSLKREASLSRVLHQTLTHRPEFIRVLEWNFEHRPFFLESEFGGPNLSEWAEAQGGVLTIPLATRLQLVASIAHAVAAAHDLGVLHRDLKPANILVSPVGERDSQVRVVDFGSGALLESVPRHDLELSVAGLSAERKEELAGTLMYSAPELLAGSPCTAGSDVYALGILLYQILSGNFHAPLTSGWESAISDPLLREDIALAASGDASMRLTSARELAERIEKLETRRKLRTEEEQARVRAEVAERRLQDERARRPWIATAFTLLCVGLLSTFWLYRSAVQERDRANHQTEIADAIDKFLAQDLLGRADPVVAGKPDESLLGAVKQAAPDIDRQFGAQPLVAAQLHSTIARALGRRSDTAASVQEFMAAADRYVQVGGEFSQEAIIERLKAALTLSRTFHSEDIDKAQKIVDAQQLLIARLHTPKPEIPVYTAMAKAYIFFASGDLKASEAQAQIALDKSAQAPSFDEILRSNLKHLLAGVEMRLGEDEKAELLLKDVIATYTRFYGPNSPVLLQAKLTLAEVLMGEGRNRETIALTSEVYPVFVAVMGDSNPYSLQVLSTRSSSEAALEQWDAAIQDEVALHAIAVKADPTSALSTYAYSDLGLFECQAGRYSQGIPHAREAYDATRKSFAKRDDFVGATAFALAYCDLGANKVNEAAPLLASIKPEPIAQLEADPTFGANLALAKAQVELAHGHRAEAQQQWNLAQKVFQSTPPAPFQKRWLDSVKAALDKH